MTGTNGISYNDILIGEYRQTDPHIIGSLAMIGDDGVLPYVLPYIHVLMLDLKMGGPRPDPSVPGFDLLHRLWRGFEVHDAVAIFKGSGLKITEPFGCRPLEPVDSCDASPSSSDHGLGVGDMLGSDSSVSMASWTHFLI